MKVAEITTFPWFSVGKIASSITDYLNDNGSACKLFYARDYREGVNYNKFANNFEIYFNAFSARIFDNDGFCYSFSTNRLIKELNNFKPDIVHLHTLHGYFLNIKKLFFYLNKNHIKIVWTMHDTRAITGHCAFFGDGNCANWLNSECRSCKFKNEYPKSIVLNRAHSNYLKKKSIYNMFNKKDLYIVSPSNWLNSFVSKSILGKFDHSVIHNGIDATKFKNLNLVRNKTLLCVASVWEQRKNLKKILEISENLKVWKIIVVGNIPINLNEKQYKNISFVKRTKSFEELIHFYNTSSIFFNPTLSDNYPTVNIEAQLCGLPVLCYDVGGNKETNYGKLEIIDFKTDITDDFLDLVTNKMKNNHSSVNYMTNDKMVFDYFTLFRKLLNIKEII